jgi:hypothetical protein
MMVNYWGIGNTSIQTVLEGIEARMEAGLGKDGDQSGKVGIHSECWPRSNRGHLRGQSRKDRGSLESGGNQPK